MNRLVEGLIKFQNEVFPERRDLFERLASKQHPRALFITCADSRIVPDLITQCEPGDLFICRNAGNIVPPYGEMNGGVSATIEYAVMALGIRNIIVCGHTDCGAMRAVLAPESLKSMPTVKSWLTHAEIARRVVDAKDPDLTGDEKLLAVTEENVIAQLDHLRTHPSVAAKLARGELSLYGWVYHIHSGHMCTFDLDEGAFVPLHSVDQDATPRPRGRSQRPQRIAS
jgi:carbonic anhydrase